jgi:hypothetical protein
MDSESVDGKKRERALLSGNGANLERRIFPSFELIFFSSMSAEFSLH